MAMSGTQSDLDKQQFHGDALSLAEIIEPYYLADASETLLCLSDDGPVSLHHDGHTRLVLILSLSGGQGIDVDALLGKSGCDLCENPRTIVGQTG
jgi:hypothetical protein